MNKLLYQVFLLKPIMAIEEKAPENEISTIKVDETQTMIEEKDSVIEEKDSIIEERDSVIKKKDSEILKMQDLSHKIHVLSQKVSQEKQIIINKLDILVKEITENLTTLHDTQKAYLIAVIENIISDLHNL